MRIGSIRRRTNAPAASGFVIVTLFVAIGVGLTQVTTYDTWGAFFLAPVLAAASLPAIARQAKRENDRLVFLLLAVALVAKLGGAVARHYVAFDVYGGAADAARYHDAAVGLAERFRAGDFSQLPPLRGAGFIEVITGLIYAVIRPSQLGGFVFFSWLGYWGMFLFYRAFVLALPQAARKSYAMLLFFLPSLIFWPSSIGKEAWMVFALGIAAFGGAQVLSGRTSKGILTVILGLWLASLVRPHTAALLGISIVVGFAFRRPKKEHGHIAPVIKVAILTGLAVGAVLLVVRTDSFFDELGLDTDAGVTGIFAQVNSRTDGGGSSFQASVFERPDRLPIAVATVLFRPLLIEAHNAQALAAAAEGTLLILLTLLRARSLLRSVRNATRQPYLALALVYVTMFIMAFSSIANFGILVRQRAQLLPVYLVLLALPARAAKQGPDAAPG